MKIIYCESWFIEVNVKSINYIYINNNTKRSSQTSIKRITQGSQIKEFLLAQSNCFLFRQLSQFSDEHTQMEKGVLQRPLCFNSYFLIKSFTFFTLRRQKQ
jgi:hypothetical protein